MRPSARTRNSLYLALLVFGAVLVAAAWRDGPVVSAGLDTPGTPADNAGEATAGSAAPSALSWNIETVDAPKWFQDTMLGAHFVHLDAMDRPHRGSRCRINAFFTAGAAQGSAPWLPRWPS